MKKDYLSLIITLGSIYLIFGIAIFFNLIPIYNVQRNLYMIAIITITIIFCFFHYIKLRKEKDELEINSNN